MDVISIRNYDVFAYHGVLDEEQRDGQTFYVSVDIEFDCRAAGISDDLNKTVNYAEVASLIEREMTAKSYNLIEACAERLAGEILRVFPVPSAVTVEIHKPNAPIDGRFDDVSVRIRRHWHTAYIGLGSNMGDSEKYVKDAIASIDSDQNTSVTKSSKLIKTKAYGKTDQPDFVNGVIEVRTLLTPYELLARLGEIEDKAGRVREERWGPRTLDLDILMYDDIILEGEDLCIPHVDMKNREFVLAPLCELAPNKVHPVYGKRVCEMLEDIKCSSKASIQLL